MSSYNIVGLTTVDNPFNPFTQFEDWFGFDNLFGYNSCSYLARVAKTSTTLPIRDYYLEVERAIDEIVNLQPQIYKKVIYKTVQNA